MRSTLRNSFGATAAVAALALTLAGCASEEPAAAPEETTTTVAVNAGALIEISSIAGQFSFDPDVRQVKVGETVTWRNTDSTKHTVTADSGQSVSFKSSTMATDTEFVQTFAEPGTYKYFCSIHGASKMSGVIEVTE
jgi:plastocyanin